jgi:hypothetical protein
LLLGMHFKLLQIVHPVLDEGMPSFIPALITWTEALSACVLSCQLPAETRGATSPPVCLLSAAVVSTSLPSPQLGPGPLTASTERVLKCECIYLLSAQSFASFSQP